MGSTAHCQTVHQGLLRSEPRALLARLLTHTYLPPQSRGSCRPGDRPRAPASDLAGGWAQGMVGCVCMCVPENRSHVLPLHPHRQIGQSRLPPPHILPLNVLKPLSKHPALMLSQHGFLRPHTHTHAHTRAHTRTSLAFAARTLTTTQTCTHTDTQEHTKPTRTCDLEDLGGANLVQTHGRGPAARVAASVHLKPHPVLGRRLVYGNIVCVRVCVRKIFGSTGPRNHLHDL